MQKQHGDKAVLIIGGKFHVLLGHYLASNSNQQLCLQLLSEMLNVYAA